MLILMDLAADLNEMTTERLRERGYDPAASDASDMRFAMLYMHTERVVMPHKYKIEVSQQLAVNSQYAALSSVIREITQRLEAGEVVTPYLSRYAQAPNDQPDDMLNYWGIHHLHLSSIATKQSNGRVKPADYLLFVRFEGEVAYLIDIRRHKQPHINVFLDQTLLEILDWNWPDLHREAIGVTASVLAPDEVKALRKSNANYAVGVNGRTIFPRMGMMANGVPCDIPFRYDHLVNQLKMVAADVRQDYYKFFGLKIGWIAHVRLIGLDDKEFTLVEVLGDRRVRVSRSF